MANEQNLIPQAHVLTVEEQSKGGVASGEAKRKRKTIAEALRIALEQPDADNPELTRLDSLTDGLISRMLKNPTAADLRTVADILGELEMKVKQEIKTENRFKFGDEK